MSRCLTELYQTAVTHHRELKSGNTVDGTEVSLTYRSFCYPF